MREADFELGIDFVAPREVRPQQVPRLVLDMFRGAYRDDEAVLAGHDLDELVVRCDRALPLQADGEDLGDVSEATFAAERNALTVLA